jgi:hypothetical protein
VVLTSPTGRKQEAAGLQFARGQTAPVPSQRVGVTQEKLRGGLEAISRDPRLVEHVTLNIAGHRLRFSVWRLGLAAVEEIVYPQTAVLRMSKSSAVIDSSNA